MTTQVQLPPHQRLSDASVRHLASVLQQLQQMHNQTGFDIFRHPETKTKDLLVSYLQRNYNAPDIDEAWQRAVASYPAAPKGRGRNHGQSGVPTPSNGGMPAPGVSPAQWPGQQGQGQQSQGQGQQSQGQGSGNYPQRPPEVQNPAMQPMVDVIWPMIKPRVYDVASEGDTALQQAITTALKAVAAQGTANGNVVIQTAVTLQTPSMPAPVNMGVQHRNFPRLLKAANARLRSGQRLNIWLYGPPGTGKTTAGEKLAEALELNFYANSALATQYELLGFRAAGGDVVRTQFRDAWEHGGVYLADEIDASSAAAILALNSALANGFCSFPDGIVRRHADCIVIAGANTIGQGATIDFVGRNKLDSTTLDRFVFVDWPLDEGLESAMVTDQKWLEHVRRIRGNVARRGIKSHMVTPRASMYGEALLAAGLTFDEATEMTLRKGASVDVWNTIQ
jgi:hypothetical protein